MIVGRFGLPKILGADAERRLPPLSMRGEAKPLPPFLYMEYRFTIEKFTAKPTKLHVSFEAEDDDGAYKYVIDEILSNPANAPLLEGDRKSTRLNSSH